MPEQNARQAQQKRGTKRAIRRGKPAPGTGAMVAVLFCCALAGSLGMMFNTVLLSQALA